MGEFIGTRVVPRHDGVWDKVKVYEPLVIVLDEESGDSYISRRDVPAGMLLTDTHYWSVCTRFSQQMEKLNEDVDADVKAMHKDVSDTKTAMSKELSDTKSAMSKELADTKSTMSQELTDTEKRVTDQVNASAQAMQETEKSMNSAVEQMQKRLDANVSASTEENADYAAELVDVRVDSDGNTYTTAGDAVRAITEGLKAKILPFSASVAVQKEYGNAALMEVKGYTAAGYFSYSGSGYVGLFAGFFGKYAQVQGKTIRVVIHTDMELTIEAFITNARNAWGSLDGSVKIRHLGQAVMNADNRYTCFLDIDFSGADIAEYAAGLTGVNTTMYFGLRRERGAAIPLCNITMYAYELTDVLNLGWKYVTGYEELMLLEAEVRNARNDGNPYESLGDVIRAHGEISADVLAAHINSWGIQYESLSERLKLLDAVARPKIPIASIQKLRDNHNLWLAAETNRHSGELVNNNAVFVFDYDSYVALEKPDWSSLHFAVSYSPAQIEAIRDKGNLWLEVLLEGADPDRPAHTGEAMTVRYYVNGIGSWGTVHNTQSSAGITIGMKQKIFITAEQIENVLAAKRGFYIVFVGGFLNNSIIKDMGLVKITAALVSDAGDDDLLDVTRFADISQNAKMAEYAGEAVHAQEADNALYAEEAGQSDTAVLADNFFLNTPNNLLNVEGKRFSPGMDTTDIPTVYPFKDISGGFQSVKNQKLTKTKNGIYPALHFEMTLSNTSDQIGNQGYHKQLNGMLSVGDLLDRFVAGYRHFYVCTVEDYLPLPELAVTGSYSQILLISYTNEDGVNTKAVGTKPVLVRMLNEQLAFTVWRVEIPEEHLTTMLTLREAGTLKNQWFGIWHTKKYTAEEPAVWEIDWYWQDYAFTDGSYTDEEMTHFFQSKYTYWASCVNHPYLLNRFAGLDERADSMEEALDELSEAADAMGKELDVLEESIKQLGENMDTITPARSITCWGDSLTAGGGWTSTLEKLSGLKVYNGGTGGENARTIIARQGADAMVVNNITIPAECTPVTIAERATDGGILTQFGNKVTPLLQGGAHVNPVMIGDVEGTLKWTGSNYADKTGIWTFTRSKEGEAVVINRPTAIRTAFDRLHNGENEIMVIYIGQNGGYKDDADLIRMHRLMIDHCRSKEYVVIGYSSGTAEKRADYEAAMLEAFGRRFISLRQYLAHPIYDTDGETVISCYGLDDAGLDATEDDIEKIKVGQVPQSLLADSVHYTAATKTVIGEMFYKRMSELGIF